MKRVVTLRIIAALGLFTILFSLGCAPVTVSSVPADASVYHKNNNKRIGTTPARINLYANSKEVVVRKDGYFSKTILLSTIDPKNIEVELKPRTKVLLLSQPNGAELYVAGMTEKVGKTPYRIDYDKPYREFEVRSFGYETQTIILPEDPEGNVVVELVREPSLMLASNPKGADVVDENGQKLGQTPMAVPAVKEITLELSKVGYYPQEIKVGPESESPFVVELEREPIIIVYSDPKDAIVTHRGVVLGKTPYRSLVKKDMELELSVNRYYTRKITVAPDSPREIKVQLDPKPYITVQSDPPNAELYRSGGVELIGKTPVEILVERDSALEMHLPGYAVKPFMLSSDSNSEVTVPLLQSSEALEKTVRIDSDPTGAKVYRPGGAELIGTTPLTQRVRFERTLELQHEGYETKIVTIAPDSSDHVVFALAEDGSAGNVAISDPLLNTPSSF